MNLIIRRGRTKLGPWTELEWPYRLRSKPNSRFGSRRAEWGLVKAQRTMGKLHALAAFGLTPPSPAEHGRCVVTFTRVGTRMLDDDNLKASFKAIRDGIAEHFGLDDGAKSKWWTWREKQAEGEYAVRVRFEFRGGPT